ncbi:MAG: PH domain-containing protein [Saprospiraceae bacterium]|nr:PH domain-containing protein [Saprospiraceae bacterium]
MRKNDGSWYETATRQSKVAILLIIFNVIKSLIRNWWPILIVVVFRSDILTPGQGRSILIVVGLAIIVFSIISYYRFYFFLKQDKLHVQRGVFTRSNMDIPFDRIQTISFEQGIVHQLFDVVKVKIDTAGSSKDEFEFAALPKSKANELRSFILSRKTMQTGESDGKTPSPDKNLIMALRPMDLLKVGVSQNHLRTAGIILAFFLGLRDRIDEALGQQYVDRFDRFAADLFDNAFTVLILMVIALLVIAFASTLVLTFLRFYNLKVWTSKDGYYVQGGLFNRREQAALNHKIQIIRSMSNPIRKLFNIVYFRFHQASSRGITRSSTISIPGCTIESLAHIRRSYFGSAIEKHFSHWGVAKQLFYRRWLIIGWIPFLILLVAHWTLSLPSILVISIVWLILSAFFQWVYQRDWRLSVNEELLQTHSGVLEKVTKIMHLYKIQSVEIRQTPYQRRHDLVSLVFYTASGAVRVPFITEAIALQVKDYTLYKIESADRKWM